MYGNSGDDLDFQMVPIDRLPNFPSPYASQQNAASRNQLFNPLSIELSDQYESLPIFFQQLVPKTHLNLVQIIQFYDRFVIRKEKPTDSYEEIYLQIFRANFSSDSVTNCEVCYQPVTNRWQHGISVHHDLLVSFAQRPKRPKGFLQNTLLRDGICPIGCGYKSTSQDIRLHLIYFHSKIQLQNWLINRDYLKYQEGLLTRREFIKTMSVDEHSLFEREDEYLRPRCMQVVVNGEGETGV